MPLTEGETLSGRKLVIAQALSGHPSLLIMGFSKAAGDPCTDWARALNRDPAFSSITVYEAAMLASAPSLVRGMIKSSMRKGLAPAEQQRFVILTSDEKPWHDFFHVSNDKDPYAILLDAKGNTLWQGHGPVQSQLPQLKSALP